MKRILNTSFLSAALLLSSLAQANPYWNPNDVPQDSEFYSSLFQDDTSTLRSGFESFLFQDNALPVWRVSIDWNAEGEKYSLNSTVYENSGTEALYARAGKIPQLGSYRAVLRSVSTGNALAYDAIGTGSNFRNLTRMLTFRFPVFNEAVAVEVWAENPQSGVLEKVLYQQIEKIDRESPPAVELRLLKAASSARSLKVNVYADGYTAEEKEDFFRDAQRVPETLVRENFPAVEKLEFRAVFAPSNSRLGRARELGYPIPKYDTFLGLFYPYWNNFGRWFNVVYPTREQDYRRSLASAAYDYPIALVRSREYWGVGNFMEITAIPSMHPSFSYLLMHEFGHFFGLNEEYEGGGRTELEFAPNIHEPWSQNISFIRNPADLKWKDFVASSTPLPTPHNYWRENPAVYGAYAGGYADSEPQGHSHKPGLGCVMDRGENFCAICAHAIRKVIESDLGEAQFFY